MKKRWTDHWETLYSCIFGQTSPKNMYYESVYWSQTLWCQSRQHMCIKKTFSRISLGSHLVFQEILPQVQDTV